MCPTLKAGSLTTGLPGKSLNVGYCDKTSNRNFQPLYSFLSPTISSPGRGSNVSPGGVTALSLDVESEAIGNSSSIFFHSASTQPEPAREGPSAITLDEERRRGTYCPGRLGPSREMEKLRNIGHP